MRKGFTLIELLAVIVILAIIALIATPIVLNIIEDSKTSGNERSIENYVHSVELKISQDQMDGVVYQDGYYNLDEIEVEVNGSKPTNGFVQIKNGEIVDYSYKIDDQIVDKENKNVDPLKINPEFEMDYIESSEELKVKGITISYKDEIKLNYYIEKKS